MLVVFGSINVDVSVPVPRLPALGETLLGGSAVVSPGGKGANQAHAARLFGSEVLLVGAVGDDTMRAAALDRLIAAGVDLSALRVLPGESTGLACIAVAPDGDNAIIVAPGANTCLSADALPEPALRAASALLLQMEVPVLESLRAARRARAAGCPVILNLAPMQPLEEAQLAAVDWLVVNETELRQLSEALGLLPAPPPAQAARMAARCALQLVLTRGAQGALLCTPQGVQTACPALHGPVADTTGAGDTFTGVFAAALAQGMLPVRALRYGVVAAGLACRRRGAQAAQPRRTEIDAALEGSA